MASFQVQNGDQHEAGMQKTTKENAATHRWYLDHDQHDLRPSGDHDLAKRSCRTGILVRLGKLHTDCRALFRIARDCQFPPVQHAGVQVPR